jgi:hypothetical protein
MDTWITKMPATIEVIRRRHDEAQGGFDLILGPHRFWFAYDPEAEAGRVEKWLRYYFRDFLPQADSVPAWHNAEALRKLQERHGTSCPECHTKLLPRLGEVGITLDEKVAATWI